MMNRPLLVFTSLWLLATLVRFALFFELRQAVGVFLDWAPGLLLLGTGALLAVAWLVRAVGRRPRRPLSLAPAVGLAWVMVLLWGLHLGPRIGAAARLWRFEEEYLEAIAVIRDDPATEPPECRDPIEVEPGPPLRVAFSWGGVLDHWSGVVHDPTGRVLAASAPDCPREITDLFGGTLAHARHLWGPWYLCSFS
jgi:hypothetical protein